MVAEVFGRLHQHVLRDIEALDCPDDFTRINFELSEYRDSTGHRLPMYEIARDGVRAPGHGV
jgi:Rha family phage regulatory protein